MPILTLTTDFGLSDNYVGVMKGVLLGIHPGLQIVDLTHQIAPQDVRQASAILASAMPYFPTGTIHLVVVDPGVGSERRPIAVQTSHASFVGPDNGVLSPALMDPTASVWVLDQPAYWLSTISQTFHGRDIFAPCAAHLASGIAPDELGHSISDPVMLQPEIAVRSSEARIDGRITAIDHFGNLITNIPSLWVTDDGWVCRLANRMIGTIVGTYADVAAGELAVLAGSSGYLEIAVRDGNAQVRLDVSVGTVVVFDRGTVVS